MVKSAKHRKELYKVLEELHLYKEKHGCFDCKNRYPHYVLEFDHKPEFNKIDVVYRVLRNYGPEAAWNEVAKCDVVCANCHKIRTYDREQEYGS
jgi:hypothetical protein